VVSELTVFFLELPMIIAIAVILNFKKNPKKFMYVMFGMMAFLFIGIFAYIKVFPERKFLLSISNIVDYLGGNDVGTGVYKISRLKPFSKTGEIFFDSTKDYIFGFGTGNCSSVTLFYKQYHPIYSYTWFASATTFLETGGIGVLYLLGLISYYIFFNLKNFVKERCEIGQCYCQIGIILGILTIILFIYNSSLQDSYTSFILGLVMSFPIIENRKKDVAKLCAEKNDEKKIGVITINGDNNYGNKLQNYAVIKIMQEYGVALNIRKYDLCEQRSSKNIILRRAIKPLFILKNQIIKKEYVFTRYKNFIKFNDYIPNYKNVISKSINYENLNKKFDFFVTGSDQIWNPSLYPNLYVNMLGFTDNKKKIAIAPSISMDKLSIEQESMFKELLSDFDFLSCREEQGAEILRRITGKKVVSLIDPTLMLSIEDWDSVSKKPKFHDDNIKYILLYFLGDLTEKYKNIIDALKSKYNLEVINILDKKSNYYSCGPSEFIYMIKNSSLILTDSFHGSVFSYIYNRPFRIFYRQDGYGYMNSRLTNLMDKLHLDNSIYLKENDSLENIMIVNYDKDVLKKEQENFRNYLNNIFKK
jgi:hypothetical protein